MNVWVNRDQTKKKMQWQSVISHLLDMLVWGLERYVSFWCTVVLFSSCVFHLHTSLQHAFVMQEETRKVTDYGMHYDGQYWHYIDKWLFALARTNHIEDGIRIAKSCFPYFFSSGKYGGGIRWKLSVGEVYELFAFFVCKVQYYSLKLLVLYVPQYTQIQVHLRI